MLCVAFSNGWSFFNEHPVAIIILLLMTTFSALGCLAMTSVCWKFKGKPKLHAWFLACGLLSYITIIGLGFYPGFTLLELRIHWIEAYFIYVPATLYAYWLLDAVVHKA